MRIPGITTQTRDMRLKISTYMERRGGGTYTRSPEIRSSLLFTQEIFSYKRKGKYFSFCKATRVSLAKQQVNSRTRAPPQKKNPVN